MPRGFDKKDLSKGNPEDSNKRPARNQTIVIDPALLQVAQRPPPSVPATQGPALALPTSREDVRRRRELRASSRLDVADSASSSIPPMQSSHQQPHQGSSAYPDAGLIGHGGPGDRFLQSNDQQPRQGSSEYPGAGLVGHDGPRDRFLRSTDVSGPVIGPTNPQSQPEAGGFMQEELEETRKAVKRSSKKRSRFDTGLSADVEENLGDAALDSRCLSRGSKRRKTSLKDNDGDVEGDSKIRKTSKLQIKIAEGKGPKRGPLGPNGEVRVRGRQLEFRDVNNPEWTPAAYHHDYRREFLDEAADEGEFDIPPIRGEADDDETSFEPEQQGWGPSREDWQNIVNSEGAKVMFMVDKPKSRRPPQEPKNWVHEGQVLLDLKNHPVKAWPGLNKTLSTEIESWRWEALMRMYPWLTVADLLARMPHTRVQFGKVKKLQTPQAFTNRAHRFRVPNQIPASNPKNGSATYMLAIKKSLAEARSETTEGLSTLSQGQIKKVKSANAGKFKENSRYVVEDKKSLETSPSSKKRKGHSEDESGSESEQETSRGKRHCTRTPQHSGAEIPSLNEPSRESIYDDNSEEPGFGCTGSYVEESQNGEELIPLFMSIYDRNLALLEDQTFTSPYAVAEAQINGHLFATPISVHWYRRSTPRYIGPDGRIVRDVVHDDFWNEYRD